MADTWCGDAGTQVRSWEGRPVEEWRRAFGLPRFLVCRRTTSSNDVARRLAENGAAAGSIVVAEEQTVGRGRGGKRWHAPRGTGLLFSMVARPADPRGGAPDFTVLPLRVGLAICAALESAAGLKAGLKWPNDVVYRSSRKLAGILCEAILGPADPFVIIGVGVNVARVPGGGQTACDPGENTRDQAPISVAEAMADAGSGAPAREWSVPVPAHVLLGAAIEELLPLASAAVEFLTPRELEQLSARDVLRSREVRIDGEAAGIAVGISPAGELLVRGEEGTSRIRGGTVRLSGGAGP